MDFAYRAYYDLVTSPYISWEFYSTYLDKEPPFGQLGLFVNVRTYSRFIPFDYANTYSTGEDYDEVLKKVPKGLRRREKWCETVLRVVNYLIGLAPNVSSHESLVNEAEQLFDSIYNLKVFPAGRTLWTGGTLAVKKNPTASFNCSFSAIDSISSIAEGFYLLLVGAGFGFSLESKYLDKLPKIYKNKEVTHTHLSSSDLKLEWLDKDKTYIYTTENYTTKKEKRLTKWDSVVDKFKVHCKDFWGYFYNEPVNKVEPKPLVVKDVSSFYVTPDSVCSKTIYDLLLNENIKDTTLNIVIGDSKEGWVNALKVFLLAYTFKDITSITIHYGNIREEGKRLKTFGGKSSGYKALEELLRYITTVFNETNKDVTSVQWLDVVNAMGKAVVVGGVRRSSEIALGDIYDLNFIGAKKDIWTNDPKKAAIRAMSNNSIVLRDKPTLEWFREAIKTIKTNGEPGFYCLDVANNRTRAILEKAGRIWNKLLERLGCNPCAEILLASKGVCNLTEVNVLAHVREDGSLDYREFRKSVRLATRIGSRITLLPLFHPDWDEVNKRDRLLGVSLTGIVEAVNKMRDSALTVHVLADVEVSERDVDGELLEVILKKAYFSATLEAEKFHKDLGIPPSLLVTTIKPSGTISQLPTVSSGIHAPYAPYYYRRVTVSKQDPLSTCLQEIGVPNEPKIGEEEKSVIFTFPIKTKAKIKSIDEPALMQLERYKRSMDLYVQHNTSCTISVAENEWDIVAEWLYENYGSWIGLSFLPRFDPSVRREDGSVMYPQMPYETCTQAQYEELAAKIPVLKENELLELLSKYELDYDEYLLEADCNSGFCPIR